MSEPTKSKYTGPALPFQVGQDLPSLNKGITSVGMMAYAAATWDFARFHYDADYARSQGFPGAFVDGQMLGAFLAQLVQNWAEPVAFLQKLSFRNRAMVYPGDTLTCGGTVTALYQEKEETLVECNLWIKNQRQERVVYPASATLCMS